MLGSGYATAMTAPPFSLHRLPDRSIIAIEGAEAEGFLQGLVTADVTGLQPGEARYGALLTPQGKILFDFFMVRTAAGFLVDCGAEQRDELIKRLAFYRLRAKLAITARDDLSAGVSQGAPAAPLHYADPRYPGLGYRVIAPTGEIKQLDGTDYRTARIAAGIADSAEIGSGQMFPHEANFDQLNGVNFSKGCYVGQEVVSRMEHRATARSRICPVAFDAMPAEGNGEIVAGGKPVGTLLAVDGLQGLALVRLDRVADAVSANLELLTGDVRVHVKKPPWAEFDIAGA